jgi:predicted aconitase
MELTDEEQRMLDGEEGGAAQRAMEILVGLGRIYGAERMVPVESVQVSGVSFGSLGDAGLEFLQEMAEDGRARAHSTLNPAGMDLQNPERLGIEGDFVDKQRAVVEAFVKMGILPTLTCTPYYVGSRPRFGSHVAWGESSAVAFANSVLGARTNREGGPSALAAALTGRTPAYGMHLDGPRHAEVVVTVERSPEGTFEFSVLGMAVGQLAGNRISALRGVPKATEDELKSYGAAIATYGGVPLFHVEKVTPNEVGEPEEEMFLSASEVNEAVASARDAASIDFVAVGCPHLSIKEVERVANLLEGRRVTKEFWVCVARDVMEEAREKGCVEIIEAAGAKMAPDTCMVVAPLRGRYTAMASDSSKACYYGRGRHDFQVRLMSLEECVMEAVR